MAIFFSVSSKTLVKVINFWINFWRINLKYQNVKVLLMQNYILSEYRLTSVQQNAKKLFL